MDEKNKFKDANPPEKKSIRNIPLTKKQAKELEKIEHDIEHNENVVISQKAETAHSPAPRRQPLRRPAPPRAAKRIVETYEATIESRYSYKLISVIALAVLAVIFGLSTLFARATVSIAQSEEVVVLSGNTFPLSASIATSSDIGPEKTIGYKAVNFSVAASTTISATGQKTVQRKATGKIVIYNESNSSQLLIATTRFQTAEGLLFRLNKNVTVPAKKNVTVDVTADQAGEKYNIGQKSFVLPGFKGTSKYKTIYGKSSSSMSGGSTGLVPQTSASDTSVAREALKDAIIKQSEEKIAAQIPEGYLLIKGGVIQNFSETKELPGPDSKSVVVSQTATVSAYYLEKNSLNSAVASKSSIFALPVANNKASIDTESLTANIIPESESKAASLVLTGTSTVKAAFDQDSIAKSISGLSRSEALAIIKAYPGIEAVEISIQPWWKRKLPKVSSIKVKVE